MYYETLEQFMKAKYKGWWDKKHPLMVIRAIREAWDKGGQGAVSAIMHEKPWDKEETKEIKLDLDLGHIKPDPDGDYDDPYDNYNPF